jgi:hypothetical protein
MSRLQYIIGSPLTLLKLTTGTAIATCPSGRNVIAGGFTTTVPNGSSANPAFMQVFSSANSSPSVWSVSATNAAVGNGNLNLILMAYAICASVQ